VNPRTSETAVPATRFLVGTRGSPALGLLILPRIDAYASDISLSVERSLSHRGHGGPTVLWMPILLHLRQDRIHKTNDADEHLLPLELSILIKLLSDTPFSTEQ
jgi:hypothetical protein